MLCISPWPVLDLQLRETLPAIFDDVRMPTGEPDKGLYDENGKRLE